MKKIILCFLFIALSCGAIFSQNTKDWNWGGTVRVDPLTTILNAVVGSFGIIVDWVPYVTPSIGIPVEIEVSTINAISGVMGGIEVIPLRHKEKSGLYLSAMGGPYYWWGSKTVLLGLKTNIGYQLVTDRGFVLTPAVGIKYLRRSGTIGDLEFNLMIGIGFAYKKR
jgi:hypothetical protein